MIGFRNKKKSQGNKPKIGKKKPLVVKKGANPLENVEVQKPKSEIDQFEKEIS